MMQCVNTSVAKKLRWDGVGFVKSYINHMKPILGLESEADVQKYIEDYKKCMIYSGCCFDITGVAAKKSISY